MLTGPRMVKDYRLGAAPPRASAILVVFAVAWSMVCGLGWLGAQAKNAVRGYASFELGGAATKALRPQVGPIWREASGARKEGGHNRPQTKALGAGAAQAAFLVSSAPTVTAAPQHVAQSFLSCRTWNPRDPPLA